MLRLWVPFFVLLLLCTSSEASSPPSLLSIDLRKIEETEAFQKFQLTISNKSSVSLGYSGEGESPQAALEVFVDGKWEQSVPCPHGAPQHVLKPKSTVTMYLLLPPSASGRIRYGESLHHSAKVSW
jgi:hypothetical protein